MRAPMAPQGMTELVSHLVGERRASRRASLEFLHWRSQHLRAQASVPPRPPAPWSLPAIMEAMSSSTIWTCTGSGMEEHSGRWQHGICSRSGCLAWRTSDCGWRETFQWERDQQRGHWLGKWVGQELPCGHFHCCFFHQNHSPFSCSCPHLQSSPLRRIHGNLAPLPFKLSGHSIRSITFLNWKSKGFNIGCQWDSSFPEHAQRRPQLCSGKQV